MIYRHFLDYVCVQMLGEPRRRSGGDPTWPCPRCDHRSWHPMPPAINPRTGRWYKQRHHCYRCGWLDDAIALIQEVEDLRFTAARDLLTVFYADYKRLVRIRDQAIGQGLILPPGAGVWDEDDPRIVSLFYEVREELGIPVEEAPEPEWVEVALKPKRVPRPKRINGPRGRVGP